MRKIIQERNINYDDYQDLDTFIIPSLTYAKRLINIIKAHNRVTPEKQ